mmetsp:Transcript_16746/g.25779  ORF Transcript_16746/g.25779 Transcript_16746/m.25779 type:complete len:92 (-) Transcript_16746:540-815(-)
MILNQLVSMFRSPALRYGSTNLDPPSRHDGPHPKDATDRASFTPLCITPYQAATSSCTTQTFIAHLCPCKFSLQLCHLTIPQHHANPWTKF